MFVKHILWYGLPPLPGIKERLETRGFSVFENPPAVMIVDTLLGVTEIVLFNHIRDGDSSYELIPQFVHHGIRVVFLGGDRTTISNDVLKRMESTYPWDYEVRFLPDLKGIHFDTIVAWQRGPRWRGFEVKQIGPFEKLNPDDLSLVQRAFPKAEEIHLRKINDGRSGSRVFMVYEKRLETETSIAHWTQPRLLKIGDRSAMSDEVGAMRAVSPFVPFELRPNLEMFIEGFKRSIYVADFVDRSESLLDAARCGRAEAAISNLFNRTLHRWRDRGRQCAMPTGSLVAAAERLGIVAPDKIRHEYRDSERIRRQGIDIDALWKQLDSHVFAYRAATIHGDLHGENVRVRGDDAILIDLGEVRGDTQPDRGAPLCFDVAMLEVALVFQYRGEQDGPDVFEQPEWEAEIKPFYELDAILKSPSIDSAPKPDSWLFGCLQRIRAFGIYDQSHSYEYAIALAIALWRWCKFEPVAEGRQADKGRRVVALELGARIIYQLSRRESGETPAHS